MRRVFLGFGRREGEPGHPGVVGNLAYSGAGIRSTQGTYLKYMKSISNTRNGALKTVNRALKLLEWVGAAQGRDPTIGQAAQSLKLNITTCYHIVNTLTDAGYLTRGMDRGLQLGPKVAVLHQAFSHRLQPRPELMAVLQNLGWKARETAYLSTWDRGAAILQAVVEAPEALRVAGLYVGLRGAMHCRAGGKVILAYLSPEEIDAFIHENPLTAHTPNTITTSSALRRALREIRAVGYAVDREEFARGVCCVAAPYFDAANSVTGAIAVSLPASRFATSQNSICKLVLGAGRQASRLLGYVEAYPQPAQIRRRNAASKIITGRVTSLIQSYGAK